MLRNLAIVSLVVFLSACAREQLIYNVKNESIYTGSGATLTTDQVRKAIRQAVLKNRWNLKETGPTSLVVTFSRGSRFARARVNYSTTSYSITYVTRSTAPVQ